MTFNSVEKVLAEAQRLLGLASGETTIPDMPPEIAPLVERMWLQVEAAERAAAQYEYAVAIAGAEKVAATYDEIQAMGVRWVDSAGDPVMNLGPPLQWIVGRWRELLAEAEEYGLWRKAGTTRARWNKKLRRFEAEAGSSLIGDGPGWQSDLTQRRFASLEELIFTAPKGVTHRLQEMAEALERDKAAAS